MCNLDVQLRDSMVIAGKCAHAALFYLCKVYHQNGTILKISNIYGSNPLSSGNYL
jgi:hypothetical protein